ncbi:MAG: GTP-binding protein [Caldilineaceae bacterium]|nr:GTP-binding protein [Caldilineaceae bacterium]MCB9149905.1 GTP-binding protein [Caldilineaceae bacterium]
MNSGKERKISKKVCLLGPFAVGKTSLVRRFIYNRFEDRYVSTIGVKVSRKIVMTPHNNEIIELSIMLWDIAGADEVDELRRSYLNGVAGAILVCDLTRRETIDKMTAYAKAIHAITPQAPLVLAANKLDLMPERAISDQMLQNVAQQLGSSVHLVSAKTGDHVEALFKELASLLVQNV